MDIFELLALRGTRIVLKELSKNKRMRYSDLVDAVGYSTTTTRALKAMEKEEVVGKEVLNEPYRPVVYFLTKRGERLASMAEELQKV